MGFFRDFFDFIRRMSRRASEAYSARVKRQKVDRAQSEGGISEEVQVVPSYFVSRFEIFDIPISGVFRTNGYVIA